MGIGIKKLLFTFFFLQIALYTCESSTIMHPDDEELVKIREHILKAYYLRPEPTVQCSHQEHQAAIKLYTMRVSEQEQEDAIMDMQASITKGTDDYFMGLPETIAALASSKIKYILYWEGLMINSATYRNPLTGKTITLHHFYTPAFNVARNYTEPETGCFMELVSCFPFPKWVSKFFKNYVPKMTRLENDAASKSRRTMFVRGSDGIGGRFTEMVKFTDNSWLESLYETNSIRKSVLLRSFPNREATITTPGDDYVRDDYVRHDYVRDDTPRISLNDETAIASARETSAE